MLTAETNELPTEMPTASPPPPPTATISTNDVVTYLIARRLHRTALELWLELEAVASLSSSSALQSKEHVQLEGEVGDAEKGDRSRQRQRLLHFIEEECNRQQKGQHHCGSSSAAASGPPLAAISSTPPRSSAPPPPLPPLPTTNHDESAAAVADLTMIRLVAERLPTLAAALEPSRRDVLIPLLVAAGHAHPNANVRTSMLSALLSLYRRPNNEQRLALVEGFEMWLERLAVGVVSSTPPQRVMDAEQRVSAEILPEVWGLASHRYSEQRCLCLYLLEVLLRRFPFISPSLMFVLCRNVLPSFQHDSSSIVRAALPRVILQVLFRVSRIRSVSEAATTTGGGPSASSNNNNTISNADLVSIVRFSGDVLLFSAVDDNEAVRDAALENWQHLTLNKRDPADNIMEKDISQFRSFFAMTAANTVIKAIPSLLSPSTSSSSQERGRGGSSDGNALHSTDEEVCLDDDEVRAVENTNKRDDVSLESFDRILRLLRMVIDMVQKTAYRELLVAQRALVKMIKAILQLWSNTKDIPDDFFSVPVLIALSELVVAIDDCGPHQQDDQSAPQQTPTLLQEAMDLCMAAVPLESEELSQERRSSLICFTVLFVGRLSAASSSSSSSTAAAAPTSVSTFVKLVNSFSSCCVMPILTTQSPQLDKFEANDATTRTTSMMWRKDDASGFALALQALGTQCFASVSALDRSTFVAALWQCTTSEDVVMREMALYMVEQVADGTTRAKAMLSEDSVNRCFWPPILVLLDDPERTVQLGVVQLAVTLVCRLRASSSPSPSSPSLRTHHKILRTAVAFVGGRGACGPLTDALVTSLKERLGVMSAEVREQCVYPLLTELVGKLVALVAATTMGASGSAGSGAAGGRASSAGGTPHLFSAATVGMAASYLGFSSPSSKPSKRSSTFSSGAQGGGGGVESVGDTTLPSTVWSTMALLLDLLGAIPHCAVVTPQRVREHLSGPVRELCRIIEKQLTQPEALSLKPLACNVAREFAALDERVTNRSHQQQQQQPHAESKTFLEKMKDEIKRIV